MDLFDLTASVTIDTAPYEQALSRMEAAAGTLVTVLDSALGSARTEAQTGGAAVGSAVVSGIQSGIRSGSAAVLATVRSLCESLVTAAKSELGIASPSKVFAQVGRYMTQGLTEGLDTGLADTRRSLAEGMRSLTQTGTLQAQVSSYAEVYTERRAAQSTQGQQIEKLLAQYLPQLAEKQTQVRLDGRTFSAALAPDMDEALGHIRQMGV